MRTLFSRYSTLDMDGRQAVLRCHPAYERAALAFAPACRGSFAPIARRDRALVLIPSFPVRIHGSTSCFACAASTNERSAT